MKFKVKGGLTPRTLRKLGMIHGPGCRLVEALRKEAKARRRAA